MATTVLRTVAFRAPSARLTTTNPNSSPKFVSLPSTTTTRQTSLKRCRIRYSPQSYHKLSPRHHLLLNYVCFASSGESTEIREIEEEIQDSQLEVEENSDSISGSEDGESEIESGAETVDAEELTSAVIASLQSYKEALASNDESEVAEIEALLKSIEDEKKALELKVASLSEEMSYEKSRVLRISADFDNFRKRTERERLSLVSNAQGEVVENLLPVLDNFERAKSSIKVETEGEEKINNSYQSIYKQFLEILGSIGVVTVETIGIPFDPMLHEAIMREDSAEFEEGIVLQEFRKGFKLGDRLLRPSMVKVSAGPGPAKSESEGSSEESEESSEEPEGVNETKEEDSNTETAPAEES